MRLDHLEMLNANKLISYIIIIKKQAGQHGRFEFPLIHELLPCR